MIWKVWKEFVSDEAFEFYKRMCDAVFSAGEPVRFETVRP